MSRVLVVGLDGATFDIIEPLVDGGRLPNLARLMDEGACGRLASTIPPVTPAAWTSFFTGKNPGKHGIFGFQEVDRQTYQFHHIRTDRHQEKTIWQLLGEQGKRSLIIDVPFTFPPRPLNGWMITGYGTPRTEGTVFIYPANLTKQLPAYLQSEMRVALPEHKFDRSQAFIDGWNRVMAGRSRLLPFLMENQSWDLFMVVFSITDNMAHVFWTYLDPSHPNYTKPEAEKYREAIYCGYETCDRLLGRLMALAGSETTTLVLSDHGFGSVRPRQYIMQQLMKGGYTQPLHSPGSAMLGDRLFRLALNSYNRFPRLREWVKGQRPGRRHAINRTMRRANMLPNVRNIDYTRSWVVPSAFGLQFWINDDERFIQGPVPAADRDRVMAELSHYLLSRRDSIDGRPIYSHVYRGSELYSGPFAGLGPDLVVEYANFYNREPTSGRLNPFLEGGHTPYGIFLAQGPDVRPVAINGTSLIDLAPTILHLLGQAIPPDMDGHVLEEMFTEPYRRVNPVRIGSEQARHAESGESQVFSAAEKAEVENQLRQLGYL